MRNKHESTCLYCKSTCDPGTADIWKTKGGWRACCDSCKQTVPEQIEGMKKHQERQKKAKERKKVQTEAKVVDPKLVLAKMSKKELLDLILSVK